MHTEKHTPVELVSSRLAHSMLRSVCASLVCERLPGKYNPEAHLGALAEDHLSSWHGAHTKECTLSRRAHVRIPAHLPSMHNPGMHLGARIEEHVPERLGACASQTSTSHV